MTCINRVGHHYEHSSLHRAILSAISVAQEAGVHATLRGLSTRLQADHRETSIATAELMAGGWLCMTSAGLRLVT